MLDALGTDYIGGFVRLIMAILQKDWIWGGDLLALWIYELFHKAMNIRSRY